MRDAEAAVMATDCPLAAIQIEQATGVRPLNPAEISIAPIDPTDLPRQFPHQHQLRKKSRETGYAKGHHSFEQYETLRPLLRPLFIAEKDRRRLA